MNKKIRANIMLTLTALIWGTAFVAQSVSMDYIDPFTFNALRSFIGGIVLIPVYHTLDSLRISKGKTSFDKTSVPAKKTLFQGGIYCGILLFLAVNFQQYGIYYTTVGKAGFITAIYIVIVPVIGKFIGKSIRSIIWLSVAVALTGLYLLCMGTGSGISLGDALVLVSGFLFALHILVIDRFSPLTDGVRMSCIQFFVCGLLSLIAAFVFETPEIHSILDAALPILFTGVMSSGVAYTLQIVAQKDTSPVVASLLLSLESAFAALFGWLLLHESLSSRELFGCALVFCAVIIAQLPQKKSSICSKT